MHRYTIIFSIEGDPDPITFAHCAPGVTEGEVIARTVAFNLAARDAESTLYAFHLTDDLAETYYGLRAARPVTA